MEAFGAAASILAIVQLAGQVSAAATSFMRDVKDARRDMIKVKKDLSALSAVLEVIAEDLGGDAAPSTGMLQNIHMQIVSIASSCRAVLLEIRDVISSSRSRLGWVTSGRARVDVLKSSLEMHMSSLDIALDMLSMIITREIKEDTSRILGDTSAIRQDTTDIIDRLEHIQQKLSMKQDSDGGDPPSGGMLERFLDELKNDAETVLGSIDYQQDIFEDADKPRQLEPEASISRPLSPPILFKDNRDRLFPVPFEACKTWSEMEEVIKQSCSDTTDTEDIEKGRYHLVTAEGQIILPKLWDMLVAPGLQIKLRLWQRTGQDETSKAAQEETSMGKEETGTGTRKTGLNEEGAVDREAPILFKDAVGRKYRFPWHLARSWLWMEHAIESAFPSDRPELEFIGRNIRKGRYALMGPDGEFIPPANWDKVVKPGMNITMNMLLLDKKLGAHQATPIRGGPLAVPGVNSATNPESTPTTPVTTTASSSREGTTRGSPSTKTHRLKPDRKARPPSWLVQKFLAL